MNTRIEDLEKGKGGWDSENMRKIEAMSSICQTKLKAKYDFEQIQTSTNLFTHILTQVDYDKWW